MNGMELYTTAEIQLNFARKGFQQLFFCWPLNHYSVLESHAVSRLLLHFFFTNDDEKLQTIKGLFTHLYTMRGASE